MRERLKLDWSFEGNENKAATLTYIIKGKRAYARAARIGRSGQRAAIGGEYGGREYCRKFRMP
jgi:hypothetical protein